MNGALSGGGEVFIGVVIEAVWFGVHVQETRVLQAFAPLTQAARSGQHRVHWRLKTGTLEKHACGGSQVRFRHGLMLRCFDQGGVSLHGPDMNQEDSSGHC